MTAHVASSGFIKTSFPVLIPELAELRLPKAQFDAHVLALIAKPELIELPVRNKEEAGGGSSGKSADVQAPTEKIETGAPFMDALLSSKPRQSPHIDERNNMMRTRNGDMAFSRSGDVLVDLFLEMERDIHPWKLARLLTAAWERDADATLRLIWNARSIHLGKASNEVFYQAAGWLAQHHPATLLANLPWLVRPVVMKKQGKGKDASKQKSTNESEKSKLMTGGIQDSGRTGAKRTREEVGDDEFELIEHDIDEHQSGHRDSKRVRLEDDAKLREFDVQHGVAHGYWKDLLNLLVLAANDQLKVDGGHQRLLKGMKARHRDWTQDRRKSLAQERNEVVFRKLETDTFYRALHVSVARLFADQLRLDMERLKGSPSDRKALSLAGKWAPTSKKFHDQHTFVASSIAELLFPFDEACAGADVDPADRRAYLKYARAAYHKMTLSPLRKAIDIVERPLSSQRFEDIRYERVPSVAMNQYIPLFIKKDQRHFEEYIDKVASGKARISGATLVPSVLVKSMRDALSGQPSFRGTTRDASSLAARIKTEIALKAAGGQWKSLVQRVKDSGKLESSIAICDVSGSMRSPRFADGTCPMDSAIGLSLLLAEVTEPPFGGAFITFSARPQVVRVGGPGDTRTLGQKVEAIQDSSWGMNTNFVSVFEDLLLPMAVERQLKPEEMVKQVFVFSDMQFDMAQQGSDRWSTSFKRIKRKFNGAGYELPRLVFWNLAGSWGLTQGKPKPVTADEQNTALISGYSQGQLKVFLGETEEDGDDEDGDVVIVGKVKETGTRKMTPVDMMRKAIGHAAYRMLRVVD